ncbi:MAG: efflux RND transporter periplasmic adaptor subunit [Cyclobacteriaceae bacterium]|nr:efflux RND transporter periplasmic adaptor subunit [Cyclobacteriaceae bacterium]
MIKTINQLAIVGILVIASCSPKDNSPTTENNKAINVQIEHPTSYDGLIQSTYSGVVEAKKTTALSFATMGNVQEVFAEEGQSVKKGQLLAKLDPSTAQNLYQAALAKQQQAEDAYGRLKPMKENGTLPEIKWVEVETGLTQAKSAVAITQKGVRDCNLYAPESGVIGKRSVQPGMNAVPTLTALELLNIQSVNIKVPVSENEISFFKKGDLAQITVNAINKTITGKISEIGVKADILSHTYPVKIEVENTTAEIKPGMICSVQLSVKDSRSGWLVSNKALQKDIQGGQFIYVVKNGQAEKIAVKTIDMIDNKILIQGEVPQNANIIISGQQKLSAGTPVVIIK